MRRITLPTLRIGMLGLGTVGSSVVNVIKKYSHDHLKKIDEGFQVTHAAVRDLSKQRACDLSDFLVTQDPMEVVHSNNVDIVIEVMGGTELAYECVIEAIKLGKPVITANKALLALHGNEIFALAKENGMFVGYEASCMGGIPIISTLRHGLSASPITSIMGIMNGTCNYILTKMINERKDFSEVLEEAQRLGYAEADPSTDIDGFDAAHKLTILASISFGIPLNFEQISIEGIRSLTLEDMNEIAKLGGCVKLLGMATCKHGFLEISVEPVILNEKHLLAQIDGAQNGILINTEATGEMFYSGKGAGGDPTASAIVADLIDWQRVLRSMPALGYTKLQSIPLAQEKKYAYYLRLSTSSNDLIKPIREALQHYIINYSEVRQSPVARSLFIIAEQINAETMAALFQELRTRELITNGHTIKIEDTFVQLLKAKLDIPSVLESRSGFFMSSSV